MPQTSPYGNKHGARKPALLHRLNIHMTTLYIKQHRATGLRYFGKTTRDPLTYNGSGKYWTNHCNKHGWEIDTIWTDRFVDAALCKEFAEFFSEFFDIVNDHAWANLKAENGRDGGSALGHKKSNAARHAMSVAKLGIPSGRKTNYMTGKKQSAATIAKRSATLTGRKTGPQSEERKANTARAMTAWWAKRKEQQDKK